jgi:nuclear transport factor 2 (NTF2) superfamily protein
MTSSEAFASRDPRRISAVFTKDAEWIGPKRNATVIALSSTDHMIGSEEIGRLLGTEIWKLFTKNVNVEFRGIYANGNVAIIEESGCARRFRTAMATTMTIASCSRWRMASSAAQRSYAGVFTPAKSALHFCRS